MDKVSYWIEKVSVSVHWIRVGHNNHTCSIGYYSSSSRRSNSDDDIEDSFSELMKYLSNIIEAVDRYLRLSPPQDLEAVQLGKL